MFDTADDIVFTILFFCMYFNVLYFADQRLPGFLKIGFLNSMCDGSSLNCERTQELHYNLSNIYDDA